jgi:hypothetical protein
MSERHTSVVKFHIGPKWGNDAVWFLMPILRRIPRPVAQAVVTALTYPSHVVTQRDGGPPQRCPGWQIDDRGLVIGEGACR